MLFTFMQMPTTKTAHGVPSTNCRWEEAETKATVTLMASLVIKRPLMYVLNSLLSPSSSSSSSSLCFYPAQQVSLLLHSLGHVSIFLPFHIHLTSGWHSCMSLFPTLASKQHCNAEFVAILAVCIMKKGINSLLTKKPNIWHATMI